MQTTRLVGFMLIAASALIVVGAVSLGLVADTRGWERGSVVAIATAGAVLGEACFWSGGALLGLSFIQRRNAAIRRFLGRGRS